MTNLNDATAFKPRKARFSPWAKLINVLAVVGSVASILSALGLFWSSRFIINPSGASQFENLVTLVSLFVLMLALVSVLVYMIAVMMFGLRAIQHLQSRGSKLRGKPWQFIVFWFVPIASIIVPALWLRDIANEVSGEQAKARRAQLVWFWVAWVLVNGFFGFGIQQPQNSTDFLTVANDLVALASVQAFVIVPLMLGRSVFKELNADLNAF